MNMWGSMWLAVERRGEGVWRWLAQPLTLRLACWLAPVFAGLLSMWLGPDSNWDLRNYHIYNAHAFLNGKIGYDLAPAQFQSYFNPALDLFYYALITYLPSHASTFIMGYLHGLNYVLLVLLGRQVLVGVNGDTRLPLLLALAGCMGFAFLTQIGNTMGDNMTSLCVLGALLLLIRNWTLLGASGVRSLWPAVVAGLVMGIGTGFKLTNANYALALCLALFALPISFGMRVRAAFFFGMGVLVGIGVGAGYWYWIMWKVFGNPLFPQFNNIFLAPLAAPIGVADTGWRPKTFMEALFWPFVFTFNPRRVIELQMTQVIWPMVYIAFIAVIVTGLRRLVLARPSQLPPQQPAVAMLLSFFAISYLIWLNLFGIYRYLVPLELLAPMVLWLLLHRLASAAVARVIGAWCVALAALIVFPLGSWGHASHASKNFDIELPHFPEPEQNMVFTVMGDPPMGWITTALPTKIAVVSLGSGFPESAAYGERVLSMVAERRGPFYMMVTGNGLKLGPQTSDASAAAGGDPGAMEAVAAANRKVMSTGKEVLSRYGLGLRENSCIAYQAAIGGGKEVFQLCEVLRPSEAAEAAKKLADQPAQ